jgi:prepilin-type N-terminal cleavage/methylation domain-containing protein
MNPFIKNRKYRHTNSISGFSLIELVVVIVIAGIVMAIATPTTLAWLRERGVRNAADQLSMDLQRAKLMAIKENANCTITTNSPAANQYTISLNGEVVDLGRYPGGVTFTNNPELTSAAVTFTPQGLCTTIPAAILLTNQNGARTFRVRVTAAGGISEKLYHPGTGKWM